jgi:hypothetical protein
LDSQAIIAITAGCIAVGFVVNRWWLAPAVGLAVGIWVGVTAEVEVDSAFLGVLFGFSAGLPVLAGFGLRRVLNWLNRQV